MCLSGVSILWRERTAMLHRNLREWIKIRDQPINTWNLVSCISGNWRCHILRLNASNSIPDVCPFVCVLDGVWHLATVFVGSDAVSSSDGLFLPCLDRLITCRQCPLRLGSATNSPIFFSLAWLWVMLTEIRCNTAWLQGFGSGVSWPP